jgi:glutaredoxin
MRAGWLVIALCLYATSAAAQFKWIDRGGRVGYGDQPPAGAHDIERLDDYVKGSRPDLEARLPYQLQRAVKDFPVTLYTAGDCPACDRGRSLLKERAVPFAERTVRSVEDVQALKKLTGSDRLPAFQVGKQISTGFNSGTWEESLDLAGYPRKTQLPADWTWPAPKPLTEPGAPPADAAAPAVPPAGAAEPAAPPSAAKAP